jgi:uncharacterized membrane protein YfcA
MLTFPWYGWLIASFTSLFIGISKTGIPGLGIIAVPLLAEIMPARASTGFLLPMLICADLFAITYYRRHAIWRHLLRLIPWAVVGIVAGFFALRRISDNQLKPVIGVIVIAMLALHLWRERKAGKRLTVPRGWWFAASMGLLAGLSTMMANAAGPIMAIYLLAMRLPKHQYLGTGAWYFFIVNLLKIPFSASLGLITWTSLKTNLLLFPLIAFGAVVGIRLLKIIPQKLFIRLIQGLTAAGAVKLLI